LLVVQPQQQ
jgi:hypothetical protein